MKKYFFTTLVSLTAAFVLFGAVHQVHAILLKKDLCDEGVGDIDSSCGSGGGGGGYTPPNPGVTPTDDGTSKRFYSSVGYTGASLSFGAGAYQVNGYRGVTPIGLIEFSDSNRYIERLYGFSPINPLAVYNKMAGNSHVLGGFVSDNDGTFWTVPSYGTYTIKFNSSGSFGATVYKDGVWIDMVDFYAEIKGHNGDEVVPLAPVGSYSCTNGWEVVHQYAVSNCYDSGLHSASINYNISFTRTEELYPGDKVKIYGVLRGWAMRGNFWGADYDQDMDFNIGAGITTFDVTKKYVPPRPADITGAYAGPSTCGNNWINLSWNPSDGAANYSVWDYSDGARQVYYGPLTAISDTGLQPGSTHSYVITAWNSEGAQNVNQMWPYLQATVASACVVPPPTAVTLTASPNYVPYNGTTTLAWTSTGADTCSAGVGPWSGTKAVNGSEVSVPLTAGTTFSITCTNSGGSISAAAQVGVGPQAPSAPTNFWAGASTCDNNWINLSWDAVSGATSYVVTEGSRIVYAGSGTAVSDSGLDFNSTHNYQIVATNGGGTSAPAYASATVSPTCASLVPTVTLTANPDSVQYLSSSTLFWNSTNSTSCSASGDWGGAKATSGSQSTGPLGSAKNYGITCVGAHGSASASASVTVYTGNGDPSVTLTASPTLVTNGAASTLTWSSENTTSCSASGDWSGVKAIAGAEVTSPITSAKSYTVTCTGPKGSASANVLVKLKPVFVEF